MLVEFDDEIQKIRDIREKKISEGLKLDIPEIDEHIRLKKGNFNVILGHANVGKTTVVLYLMLLYSIKHNLRWLIFSSENDPYTLIKKIIEFLENKPINKIPNQDFDAKLSWINDHFKFISNEQMYSWKDLKGLAQAIKNAWNYDGFIIDPYNSLIKKKEKGLNGNEYNY